MLGAFLIKQFFHSRLLYMRLVIGYLPSHIQRALIDGTIVKYTCTMMAKTIKTFALHTYPMIPFLIIKVIQTPQRSIRSSHHQRTGLV